MPSKEDTWQNRKDLETSDGESHDAVMSNETTVTSGEMTRGVRALLGKVISGHDNKYKILEIIGRGGSGDVYKARLEVDENTGSLAQTKGSNTTRVVACKVLSERLLDNQQHYKRFQHEARLAKRLIHPNIVNVHDAGEVDGRPFIILDYLEGKSLSAICEGSISISIHRALPIFLQISKAFAYAHLNNIIHRDLKPGNIMLIRSKGNDDFVKVVDFGIAKIITETTMESTKLTKTGEIFGSPLYMSPEQCRGEALDVRCDIYSFGILMYEVLTGSTPFRGTDTVSTMFKHTTEAPKSIDKIDDDVLLTKKVEKIIFKCLEKDPELRYQTMDDITRDLESLQLHLDQMESGQANKIFTAGQKGWLYLLQIVRKAQEYVFSKRLSSSGLTVGSVLVVIFLVLALVGVSGWAVLFGSLPTKELENRQLPFKPIIYEIPENHHNELGENVWSKLIDSRVLREPPILEKALELFLRNASASLALGKYERSCLWYYRATVIWNWLQGEACLKSISLYNSYAEALLYANLKIPLPNKVQLDQAMALLQKEGKLVSVDLLKREGLIYATNAASARDAALIAMTGLRDLSIVDSRVPESLSQTLLSQGLLAEAFRQIGSEDVAKIGYDQFYSTLTAHDSLPELPRRQRTYLLSSSGKFYLNLKDFSKSNYLLSRLLSEMMEIGDSDLGKYDIAVTYNDLGLIKESQGKPREAEGFFIQSREFLDQCSNCESVLRQRVANNIVIDALASGDLKTALQVKFSK